jgi:hypothetical protein
MRQTISAAYHSLIAAVINRAVDDLKGIGPPCREKEIDRAMAFVLSDRCEAYCLELGIDCKTIREKAAALYRQIIAKEEKKRYADNPWWLSDNRHFRTLKMRPTTLVVGTIDYPSPRGSSSTLTNSRKSV